MGVEDRQREKVEGGKGEEERERKRARTSRKSVQSQNEASTRAKEEVSRDTREGEGGKPKKDRKLTVIGSSALLVCIW